MNYTKNYQVNEVSEEELLFIPADFIHEGKPYSLIIATNILQEPLGYLQYSFRGICCFIKALDGDSDMIKTLLEVKLMEKVPSILIFHEL